MTLAAVTLDDKYVLRDGRVYMTGTQALVRLPMLMRDRDRAAGLNTAGFISGYRGSPLGAYDQALWQARKHLARHDIHFQPGVNEELGATAVWGSQQVNLFKGAKVDGVFGIWYGKGPGVDRSLDALKHANFAGTGRYGGVLAIAGDDHASKSSTLPHQSDHAFIHAFMPVMSPAGVQEFLDYGLIGWEMSRYSGCWVGFTALADTIDTSAIVRVPDITSGVVLPADFEMPPGRLNIRLHDTPLIQEDRMIQWKLDAARAFARSNRLDKVILGAAKPRLGIVTVGKSYLDVRQALDELGITAEMAADLGIAIFKVAMTWPLEPHGIRDFAESAEELLVVEEKRALIEAQLKEQLYNWDRRPRILGKTDEEGRPLLSEKAELSPTTIALALAGRMAKLGLMVDRVAERVKALEAQLRPSASASTVVRAPFYCSGCPHNTSTHLPEGSRGLAGIGCHYMVTWMGRNTDVFSQMGGEGVHWIGQAPFAGEEHVFANLGDGTYFHSGILAVRASVAAKVNITYKILYNDAVAMTGGQKVDGSLSVHQIARQLEAEGVERIVVVSDDPEKYGLGQGLPPFTTIEHRDDLDRVQREMREIKGVSVLIYEQTCAAEKRRRRKRGTFPDPARRVVVNELVCEGCGDCSAKSSCLSVVPVETEFGRKRQIDQSSCNKDFSCLKGFCPSFVTVEGGSLRKPKPVGGKADAFEALPEPVRRTLDRPWNILVTGVGGTGVVTIGAIVAMASHLESRGCTVLDMAGLAQKGGAVTSHLRIAERPEDIHATRIAAGGADVVLGCDIVVAANADALTKMAKGRTHAILNTHEAITAAFVTNPDFQMNGGSMVATVAKACGADAVNAVDATRIATGLLGDSIATNLFMLGYAYQKGLVPVSAEALEKAIEMNGAAVKMNTDAFRWGRRAALDQAAVEKIATPKGPAADQPHRRLSQTLDEAIERRAAFLTDYQDAAYADAYRQFVAKVRSAETAKVPGADQLTEAVARTLFKLMAYKDEYEVARLYTQTGFLDQVRQQFQGDYKLVFHLAPPTASHTDPATGEVRKRAFGPWMLTAFRGLARLKGLRGTALDIFGRTAERRMERQLIVDFRATVEELLAGLAEDNHALAVEIAELPQKIRGYGHVKEKAYAEVKAKEQALLRDWRAPAGTPGRSAPLAAE
ncbi:indolepyruvate ferredoxin oxidoreductase family protein [Nitrospirillum sp. BR 11752]|uniref:indolepyruvate ferredoxin oxidoreductase family protein n=1 Tax=Nitrospirillum sp. BR 11752 TaxID=3104293 RepID=UPI002E9C151E|nr:indolepyruvate ferredoxin oxidoreductase family protein [Nitrospirillum sp. BR 11752]